MVSLIRLVGNLLPAKLLEGLLVGLGLLNWNNFRALWQDRWLGVGALGLEKSSAWRGRFTTLVGHSVLAWFGLALGLFLALLGLLAWPSWAGLRSCEVAVSCGEHDESSWRGGLGGGVGAPGRRPP